MNLTRRLTRLAHMLRQNGHKYTRAVATAHYQQNVIIRMPAVNVSSASKLPQQNTCRLFSSQTDADSSLDSVMYDRVCSETLDALSDYFDELTENATNLAGSDVAYGDGVLTVNLGQAHGTYVINRQTPNKQIWLSSPTSGPKRFDFVITTHGQPNTGRWIYKHSGESLHQLLQQEIENIFQAQPVDFMQLQQLKLKY